MKQSRPNQAGYDWPEGFTKILRMIKLSTFFIFIGCLQVSAAAYSQKSTLSISLKEMSLQQAFNEISQESGYLFLYNNEKLVQTAGTISVSLKDATIDQVMEVCLADKPLSYSIIDKTIVIKPDSKSAIQDGISLLETARLEREISGKIIDETTGEPLAGVTISVKDSNIGTVTDINGNYSLEVEGDVTLVASFVGFQPQEIKVEGRSNINVVMTPSSTFMDELVVVGMNNKQKEKSITGSLATIKTKELKQSPVANLSNALAGRLPGLITVQSSGEPGDDAANLFIRGQGTYGNTDPLIVVDGLPRGVGDLNQIDPNEVESITILKDAASTALYGIQGANGVVVVSTKRGSLNSEPTIEITAQRAIQEPILLPQNMDVYDLALFKNLYAENSGLPADFNEEALEAVKTGSQPYLYPNVDWFNYVLAKNAPQQQYNLNINGGTERVRYFISGSYLNQSSLMRYQNIFEDNYGVKSNFNRYNFRSNVDIDATDMLHIKVDLAGRLEDRSGPAPGFSSIFSDLTNMDAFNNPVFNPNGTLGGASNVSIGFYKNPLGQMTQSGYSQEYRNVMTGTLSAKHDLDFVTRGLSTEINFSFESNNVRQTIRSQDFDSYWYRGLDLFGDSIYQEHTIRSSLSTSGSSNIERSSYLDLRINYEQIFGDHRIMVQALGTRTLRRINDELPYAYQGLSSHLTYSFKDKYFLEGDMAYNGSENFPKKRRYGFFPSVSAGWVISDESFLDDKDWLKFLKIRGSYGVVGNDKIGGERFLFISDFTSSHSIGFGEVASYMSTMVENRVGNMFVTWEKSSKTNIGFDLDMLRDRNIHLTFDLFRENRRDILTAPNSVPSYDGIINLAPRNSGRVLNQGFDFELRLNKRLGEKASAFINFQLTYAKNEVLENDEPTPQEAYQELRGYPIGTSLGREAIGFFKDNKDIDESANQGDGIIPGDIKYKDINDDGVIDEFDRIPIRLNNVPEILGGVSLGLVYQGIDFSLLFNGAAGGTSQFISPPARAAINKLHWTPELGNQAMVPSPHRSSNNSHTSTFWIQNADYLKLRNAEIGYQFPQSLLEPLHIKYARVFLNGQNLLLWDRLWIKDRDPETSSRSGTLPYPVQRVFNAGINIRF